MSSKEEALRELSDDELLKLAGSVSESPVKLYTSRSILTKIVRESLSLAEIREKVKGIGKRHQAINTTRARLIPGGVGQLFLSASAMISILTYEIYIRYLLPYYFPNAPFAFFLIGLANSIVFFFFVVLFMKSAKTATDIHGRRTGTYGVYCGFVAFAAILAYYILALVGVIPQVFYTYLYPSTAMVFGQVLSMVYSIFLGVALILIGVFFIANSRRFLNFQLWFLAGVIYVFAGVAEVPLMNVYYANDFTAIAGILGGLCFLAKTPPISHETVKLTHDNLRVGAIGQIGLAASGALMVVGYFWASVSQTDSFDYYRSFAPWGLASSATFLIFGILFGFSMVRVASNLGSNLLGLGGALLAVISAVVGMLYYGLTISGATTVVLYYGASSVLNGLGITMSITYTILVCIAMTSLGAFFLLNYEHAYNSEPWMASGIVYIIVGSYALNLMMALYGPISLCVAGSIGAACFLAGKAK